MLYMLSGFAVIRLSGVMVAKRTCRATAAGAVAAASVLTGTSKSLGVRSSVGYKPAPAVHFWLRHTWCAPVSCAIAELARCEFGKNYSFWGRFGCAALREALSAPTSAQAINRKSDSCFEPPPLRGSTGRLLLSVRSSAGVPKPKPSS